MPGTTTAVMYVKPTARALLSVDGKFSAKLFIAPRALEGIYSQTNNVIPLRNTRNIKKTLPHSSVPIGYVTVMQNGKPTQLPVQIDSDAWYPFFWDVVNRILGGPSGSTLPDVISAVGAAQTQGATATASAVALSQVVVANAASTAAAVAVVQSVSLPGATQIPTPVTAIPELAPGGRATVTVSRQTE